MRPRLHLFNPSCEAEAARGRPGLTPSAAAAALARDLEALPLFLADPRDAVLVAASPSNQWLDTLRLAGFALPRFVTSPANAPDHAPAPWGASPDAARRLGSPWSPAHRARYAKTWPLPILAQRLADAAPGLCDPLDLGQPAATMAAVDARVAALRAAGVDTVALKAPFGTSGRGTLRLRPGDPTPPQTGWISRTLATQGALLVEPWRDRLLDLSALLEVGDEGVIHCGFTRFATDERGQYLGAWLAHPHDPLIPARWRAELHATAAAVGVALRAHGHRGLAGLDAMVYRDAAGAPRLKPLLEVNPRATMGHVALALARAVAPGHAAVWRLFAPRDARALGLPDLPALGAALARSSPAAFVAGADRPLLASGTLCTNDPARATTCLGVIAVVPGHRAVAPLFFYNPLTTG